MPRPRGRPRKMNPDQAPEPESNLPVLPISPEEPAAPALTAADFPQGMPKVPEPVFQPFSTKPIVPVGKPVQIVDVEEAIQQQVAPEEPLGTRFFFGELGKIPLGDGTSYHVTAHHTTIRDTALLEKLRTAALGANGYKIFEQTNP